jgi:hypothetical protein
MLQIKRSRSYQISGRAALEVNVFQRATFGVTPIDCNNQSRENYAEVSKERKKKEFIWM